MRFSPCPLNLSARVILERLAHLPHVGNRRWDRMVAVGVPQFCVHCVYERLRGRDLGQGTSIRKLEDELIRRERPPYQWFS